MINILTIGERIRKAREYKGLSRRDLEKLTKIVDHTWTAIESGKQKANSEHIEALGKLWPDYKMWLAFGETIPEAGQTSPEIEEKRQDLGNAGRAA